MAVWKPPRGKTWRYDFRLGGRRYVGNTRQTTEDEAQLAEEEIQRRIRHELGGITHFFPQETPRFQDWVEIFTSYQEEHLDRPDHVEAVTRVLLRFFGARPTDPAKVVEGEPYHDLRLGDLIADPQWLLAFEQWMARRHHGTLSNQSRNHYRGMLRRMYALALRPEYRATTGITLNPLAGVPSDPTHERTVAHTPDQVRAWLAAASYHVRLAIAIAALAPKLRLRNVLALDWAEHFDPDPRTTKFSPKVQHYIRVRHHKTARHTKKPLVAPVSAQLLRILKDAWERAPKAKRVVLYRGLPVKSIRGGVKAAAEAAGIRYGREPEDGATFHTLRHTAATLLSSGAEPLELRDAMGHTDLRTTMKYRHLRPVHERPTVERLSRILKLEDLVTAPHRRAKRQAGVLGEVQAPADHDRGMSNKIAHIRSLAAAARSRKKA